MNYHLTAIIWEENGKYVSKCPELEVASWGRNPQEAKENLRQAVELYIENAKDLGIFEDIVPSLEAEINSPLHLRLQYEATPCSL